MNLYCAKGHLGHAATVRVVGDKRTPVVNFSLAVKVGYGANERTEWRDCSWWGVGAEKCVRWLTKGREVVISGEPSVRLFEKRDKTWGSVMEVRVDKLHFCGTRDAGEGAEGEAPAAVPAAGETERAGNVTTVMKPAAPEEDVPF
jgi:single-strand DNA-binding protein